MYFSGGWTLVGNLDGKRNGKFRIMKAFSTDINQLWKVKHGKFALTPRGLNELHKIFPFTQIRFYCERASKVSDITTYPTGIGHEIFTYVLFNNITKPTSCPGFYQTSLNKDMPVNCDRFVEYFKGGWKNSMLYKESMVMKNKDGVEITNYFDASRSRYQCAESKAERGRDGIGVWKLFVR